MAHGGVEHGTSTKSTGYGLTSPTMSPSPSPSPSPSTSTSTSVGTITKRDIEGYNSSTFDSPTKSSTNNSNNGYSEMFSNLLPMMLAASMMFSGAGDNLNSVFAPNDVFGGGGMSGEIVLPFLGGMGGNGVNPQQSFMMGFMMAMAMFQMQGSFPNNQVTPYKTM